MGSQLPDATIDAFNAAAQRLMTRGEIGIVLSNVAAWRHALEAGWEWALVLEDDARLISSSASDRCNCNMFLSSLPFVVEAAQHYMSDWQLIVLNPINEPHDFLSCVPSAEATIPHVLSCKTHIGRKVGSTVGIGWQICPPTVHAFGWIYRRSLMEQLLHSFETNCPRHDVHDIWVWEAMAHHGVLPFTVSPNSPLVRQQENSASVKDMQDGCSHREAIWAARGHGK